MKIIKVEYLSDYKLKLTFSKKEIKIVDLSEKIKNAKGIFIPLKDVEYFKKVRVDDCLLSIFWPNGADICPDVLYEMGKPILNKKKTTKKPLRRYGLLQEKYRAIMVSNRSPAPKPPIGFNIE